VCVKNKIVQIKLASRRCNKDVANGTADQ